MRRDGAGFYLLLVLAASVPFYALGALWDRFPGLPIALPPSSLVVLVPVALAVLLGGRSMLARALDLRRAPPGAVLLALLLPPALLAVAALAQRLLGQDLPAFAFDPTTVAVMIAMFLLGALCEEIGWQGYAWPRLAAGRSVLAASLGLGLFWAFWHIPGFIQTGHPAEWIVLHLAVTVLLRVQIIAVYRAGHDSVALAALFHASCNLAFFLFPTWGSADDPGAFLLVLALFILWNAALRPGLRRDWHACGS